MVCKISAPVGTICDGKFLMPIRIYYEDTDAGGIVYYANYLKFAERARTEFLRYVGADSQQRQLEDSLCGFVVRHLEIDYRAPAKLDDLLTVSCEVCEAKGAVAVMRQEICREDEILATIDVKVVYLSLAKKRPVRIPADIINKIVFLKS